MPEWSLQDAKNRFSAVVRAAMAGQPQAVTRRGDPAVVVIGISEYRKLLRAEQATVPTFIDHLLAIPKGGPDDLFEREELNLRDVDL